VGRGEHRYEPGGVADWEVSLVETGEHSLTGTRLYHARDYIRAPNFCLTYGDGLSDIALDRELQFHLKHGKLGTVAAVHPPSRFGKLEIVGGTRVRAFREKEKLSNDYVNGGFMVFRREMLDRLSPAGNESLESTTLTRLAADGKLQAYLHDGFWRCMDTLRDREQLDAIYESGKAPWVRW
jgi:glucose-1-phosphate cytidylyltransferase